MSRVGSSAETSNTLQETVPIDIMSRESTRQKLRERAHLQVALDMPDVGGALRICNVLPVERVILEVGTPLLKSHGIEAIREIRRVSRGRPVIADTKTLDAAELEVRIAKEGGADGATVSALAPFATIEKFGAACERLEMICLIDLLGHPSGAEGPPIPLGKADVLVCHMGIDQGTDDEILRTMTASWRRRYPDKLIAVAGGIVPRTADGLLREGADIIIVGRYVTASDDPGARALELVKSLNQSAVH